MSLKTFFKQVKKLEIFCSSDSSVAFKCLVSPSSSTGVLQDTAVYT